MKGGRAHKRETRELVSIRWPRKLYGEKAGELAHY